MRWIDAETVERLTPFEALIDWLAECHRAPPALTERALIERSAPDGVAEAFLSLPAWAPGEALGIKVATVFPRNAEREPALPTIHAIYQLFDGATGEPVAAIDGTMLTLRKTAADSGLGCRLLAAPDAKTLLMVGAGALAPHLVAAHRAARPGIERVLLWNRTHAKAEELARRLGEEDVPAEAVAGLEQAARAADIICCATMAREPLIRGTWLKPGCHLDLVGGFTPAMREADDEACRRARIFVDARETTIGQVGDLMQPMASGAISEAAVEADLHDLARGDHPGRGEDGAAITLYKNGGGGALDLMVARFIAERAR